MQKRQMDNSYKHFCIAHKHLWYAYDACICKLDNRFLHLYTVDTKISSKSSFIGCYANYNSIRDFSGARLLLLFFQREEVFYKDLNKIENYHFTCDIDTSFLSRCKV